jgi:hypothetical protein
MKQLKFGKVVVCTATRYGDRIPVGPIFSISPRPARRFTQRPVQWVLCYFREVNQPERGADHEPNNGLKLYLRLPSVPAQSCQALTFT